MLQLKKPPSQFLQVCTVIFLIFWAFAAIRHSLLQSNAYDLGLFDQWIWLTSQGLPPYSSMEGSHILADHGAIALYLASIPYLLHSSLQWLLASQAAALSLTAVPLWWVGKQAGLSEKVCWFSCGLWWLQPVVFNTNLFDFHPEVWVMPALAGSYFASRQNKPLLWFGLLIIILSCRDGLILVVLGLGLEQIIHRKWIWATAAMGLALSWLGILNKWVYPSLTGHSSGPKAASGLFSYLGNSFNEILLNAITKPNLIIDNIDWNGGLIYLLLISVAVAPLWRKASLPTLIGCLPLVVVNLLSEASPQRTLIHHYSLPIAVIVVVAAIDGLSEESQRQIPWRILCWSAICWAVLAKPWFFTGPYLKRVNSLSHFYEGIKAVPEHARLSTTSYLVPHLSQRTEISFPTNDSKKNNLDNFDVLLLNPIDPGWGSNGGNQKKLLDQAKRNNWSCKAWENGLTICQAPP